MVATARVIPKVLPSGKLYTGRYYTAGASEHYLTLGGERQPVWLGESVKTYLGLPDFAVQAHVARIAQGTHPTEQRELVPLRQFQKPKPTSGKKKRQRQPASCLDIALNFPKRLTVYWVFSPEETRREIEAAGEAAARAAFTYIQDNLPLARRGQQGKNKELADLLGLLAFHRVSRAKVLCPHLHFHLNIQNLCRTKDGKWQAIDTSLLLRWVRTIGPVFRAALAKELKQRLGLKLIRPTNKNGIEQSWFELDGVPKDLADFWSDRQREIHEKIDRGSLSDKHSPLSDPSVKARENARIKTRDSKQTIPPEKPWIDSLRKRTQRFGFTQEKAEQLLHRAPPIPAEDHFHHVFSTALQKLTATQSHFSYRDLVRQVAEEFQTVGVSPSELTACIKQELAHSQELIHLTDRHGYERFTTKKMWDLEEALEKTAKKLMERPGFSLPRESVDHFVSTKAKRLTVEQAQAVLHIFTSPGSCKAVTGVAGSGKSRMLDAVRAIYEKAGKKVIGVALSGAAKEELTTGANLKESRTIASLLYHTEKAATRKAAARATHDAKQFVSALKNRKTYRYEPVKLTSNHVVILDEAGMVDTATALRILRRCERAGAELVMVGDDHQLQPIGAGGVLRYLKKQLPHLHMQDNLRQIAQHDRIAVENLREGKAKNALAEYQRRGKTTVAPTRSHAAKELVRTWVDQGGVHRPSSHVAFTMTRAEAHEVNCLIQHERRVRGAVKGYQSVRSGRQEIYAYDRIMVHVPYRKLGLENGFRGTVLSVNSERRELLVRFDQVLRPRGRKRPHNNTITVPLKDLPEDAVTLGYAFTTHKMQGATCDHAYVLAAGRMTDRELTYVQATRGRRSTRFFLDELHAGKNLEDFANAVARSRRKDLAHDYQLKQKPDSSSPEQGLSHEA